VISSPSRGAHGASQVDLLYLHNAAEMQLGALGKRRFAERLAPAFREMEQFRLKTHAKRLAVKCLVSCCMSADALHCMRIDECEHQALRCSLSSIDTHPRFACIAGLRARYKMATWSCFRTPPGDPGHLSLQEVWDIAARVGGLNHGFRSALKLVHGVHT
jgi:hypothetical protein